MSVQQLPNKRWRATIIGSDGKRISAAKVLGLEVPTFPSKRAAQDAVTDARRKAATQGAGATQITVREWWERWTTDPLFRRPKESTMRNYIWGTSAFVEQFGAVKMADVDHQLVARWLAGGQRNWTVLHLRVMFGDATRGYAGRLIPTNPFSCLGLGKGKGNQETDPPSEEIVWKFIECARRIAPPGFAAWLQVACWSGLRPGELDALCQSAIDFDRGMIRVERQLSSITCTFTTPKNGQARDALLHEHARDALLRVWEDSESYCFVNLQNSHWTEPSRRYWWKKLRAEVGYDCTIYMATRHFYGRYLYEELRHPAEDVAVALGHTDKGNLVRRLYGHHNSQRALERVAASFKSTQTLRAA